MRPTFISALLALTLLNCVYTFTWPWQSTSRSDRDSKQIGGKNSEEMPPVVVSEPDIGTRKEIYMPKRRMKIEDHTSGIKGEGSGT